MRLTHLADYAVVMMTAAARRGDGVRAVRGRAGAGHRRAAADRAEIDGPAGRPPACSTACAAPAAGSRWRGRSAEISLADIVEAVEGPIAHDHVQRHPTKRPTARSTPIAGSSRTWAWSAVRCAARSARR